MEIRVEARRLSRVSAGAAVIFVAKGEDPARHVREAGRGFVPGFQSVRRRGTFTGALGQVVVLHGAPGSRIETLVLAGVGDKAAGADGLRSAAADAAKAARDAGADRLAVLLPSGGLPLRAAAETVVEGVQMGLYVFDAYKAEKSKRAIKEATLLAPRAGLAAAK